MQSSENRAAFPLLSLALVLLSGPGMTADQPARVRIPGTAVSLMPPEGFVVAEEFAGLTHPETLYATTSRLKRGTS